jgi:hypothetical protein
MEDNNILKLELEKVERRMQLVPKILGGFVVIEWILDYTISCMREGYMNTIVTSNWTLDEKTDAIKEYVWEVLGFGNFMFYLLWPVAVYIIATTIALIYYYNREKELKRMLGTYAQEVEQKELAKKQRQIDIANDPCEAYKRGSFVKVCIVTGVIIAFFFAAIMMIILFDEYGFFSRALILVPICWLIPISLFLWAINDVQHRMELDGYEFDEKCHLISNIPNPDKIKPKVK